MYSKFQIPNCDKAELLIQHGLCALDLGRGGEGCLSKMHVADVTLIDRENDWRSRSEWGHE